MHTNFQRIIFLIVKRILVNVSAQIWEKSEQLSRYRPYLALSLQETAGRKQDEVLPEAKRTN